MDYACIIHSQVIYSRAVFFLKDAKRNLWGAFRRDGARQTGSGRHRRGKKGMLFRLAAGGDIIGSGRCQPKLISDDEYRIKINCQLSEL